MITVAQERAVAWEIDQLGLPEVAWRSEEKGHCKRANAAQKTWGFPAEKGENVALHR